MNAIPAIPTKYNGTQFRSRLEARWAAFFDLVSWPWEYEPIDLAGYIPDFILRFTKPLLVEVKPLLEWSKESTGDAFSKIHASSWNHDAVLVGATLRRYSTNARDLACGQFVLSDGVRGGGNAAFLACLCGISLFDDELSYHCRRCGNHGHGGHPQRADSHVVEHAWREAGNRVQWRGVEARP